MHGAAEQMGRAGPFNRTDALHLSVCAHSDSAHFFENEQVAVRILSLGKNNTLRIAVKGSVLQAQSDALPSAIQEGALLHMRVHIIGNRVVFTPYPKYILLPVPHTDIFSQLGIPRSDLAALLIAFFRQNEQSLHPLHILKLLSVLKNFAPYKKNAAFVAALLYSRGIEPSSSCIVQCLSALLGLPTQQHELSTDAQDQANLFRFINHVKSGKNHWVVLPFEMQLGVQWKGSTAFLLDLQNNICLECCLRARSKERGEAWLFTFKNHVCQFSVQGLQRYINLSARCKKKLAALLTSCFKSFGVCTYTAQYSETAEDQPYFEKVDIYL